ncbi:hypothetical protein EDD17DRAFT_1549693 [Pisolithus thermaeus]|nr:hypothetical protein EDD17DRAFT_1549693 [Pisolithus thermaeus]
MHNTIFYSVGGQRMIRAHARTSHRSNLAMRSMGMGEHTLSISPWTSAPCRQTSKARYVQWSHRRLGEGLVILAHESATEKWHFEGNKPRPWLQQIHKLALADRRRVCEPVCNQYVYLCPTCAMKSETTKGVRGDRTYTDGDIGRCQKNFCRARLQEDPEGYHLGHGTSHNTRRHQATYQNSKAAVRTSQNGVGWPVSLICKRPP